MQVQLTIFDLLERLETSGQDTVPLPDLQATVRDNSIPEDEVPFIREYLLIETVKSAFGMSRGGRNRQPDDESWEWIVSEDQASPFSFRNCCLSMGVSPDDLLEWLFWYRKKLN